MHTKKVLVMACLIGDSHMKKQITSFTGEYRFLSNFYPSPIKAEEITFPTAEHYYQAMKCKSVDDFKRIALCATPGQAKRLGQKVVLKKNWNDIRVHIMRRVLEEKFSQNPDLCQMLLSTKGHELIEGNTWGDTFFGQCPIGTGLNHLGILLMELRDSPFMGLI